MPINDAQQKWRENNKEYYNTMQNIYTKKHYINNREKRLAYAKEYRENNKQKISAYQKELREKRKQLKEIEIENI
jgi:hypothetical protein